MIHREINTPEHVLVIDFFKLERSSKPENLLQKYFVDISTLIVKYNKKQSYIFWSFHKLLPIFGGTICVAQIFKNCNKNLILMGDSMWGCITSNGRFKWASHSVGTWASPYSYPWHWAGRDVSFQSQALNKNGKFCLWNCPDVALIQAKMTFFQILNYIESELLWHKRFDNVMLYRKELLCDLLFISVAKPSKH